MQSNHAKLKCVSIKDVVIDDAFWNSKLNIAKKVTLFDVFNKFQNLQEGTMSNFDWVAQGKQGKHVGPPWFDGLIYETMRAAADFLCDEYDEKIDALLDGYIERIAKAQAVHKNGYINTYTTTICPQYEWGENGGNILYQHEIYNAGCLVEAAVHHFKATNKTNLLLVAVKLANYMADYMGPLPKKSIVPAHPLPEEAFIKLYQLFKENPVAKTMLNEQVDEKKYLELAKFWIDDRGSHQFRKSYPRNMGEYAQDHRPLLEQDEAMGHAVRAVLLYNGVTALAMENGDQKYYEFADRLWNNVVNSKMHITGGVGAVHNEEKFGYEYQLPNDAYLETCAAAAMVFWAGNMNAAFGDAKYFDVFEKVIYNGFLSGISLSGDKYFYTNPLISNGDNHRWDWHGCPCCPPMYLKLMSSLKTYLYSMDDDGVYVNMFVGGHLDFTCNGQSVQLIQTAQYPWNGTVSFGLNLAQDNMFQVCIRVPAWCEGYRIEINGKACTSFKVVKGYAVLKNKWANGDTIQFVMDMPIVRIQVHPYVVENKGMIAIQRGPLVYCLEEADNNNLFDITLPKNPQFSECIETGLLDGVVAIKGIATNQQEFKAIPYYVWDNREPGAMRVWIGSDDDSGSNDLESWGNKLYRSLQN